MIEERILDLKISLDLHKDYLDQKIVDEDWHGVADAAMDIRDIEAEIKGLKFALDQKHDLPTLPKASS